MVLFFPFTANTSLTISIRRRKKKNKHHPRKKDEHGDRSRENVMWNGMRGGLDILKRDGKEENKLKKKMLR